MQSCFRSRGARGFQVSRASKVKNLAHSGHMRSANSSTVILRISLMGA